MRGPILSAGEDFKQVSRRRRLRLLVGAPQADRNDFYFLSATPEANSTNQSCDYIQPMAAALRNVAVATALRLRYVALRCVMLETSSKALDDAL